MFMHHAVGRRSRLHSQSFRTLRAGFVVLAVFFGPAVPAASAQTAPSGEPFRIGAILSKTGAFSQYGQFIEQGLNVAVKRINANGGILSRPVKLIIRDDASNPGRALLAAKSLVADEKVDVIYPEVISGLALAVLPYTTQKKILTISSGASPLIGDPKKFPYSFQLADVASKRTEAVAAALKKVGAKKVGILVSTNPPQVALGDTLAADLPKKYGIDVAGYKQFSVEAKDLAPQLQSLRDAGADTIAFDSGAREGVRVVMTGMQTLGWKAKVVSEPAVLYGDLTEQVPASVHDQFLAVNYRVGTWTGTPRPELSAFIKDLKLEGPVNNLPYSALANDAVYMAKWAFETAMKEKGNTKAETLKEILETRSAVPAGYSVVFSDPKYSATDHTTTNADYTEMWGLIRVSKPRDGAYEGEDFSLSK
ncbi:ABC transporter substrate-binding protein [Pollutimonas bauzanensis]|uniref:Amino acid/amide ABC transporter substrate-binding protein, HAAT family n=1 Tax=Pollutimonas bauzanensis TaxID=658167 RepID=A0A1M5QLC8_9BURK|nr:ABC transporter substrate-binding protein [Pollutimonas bauzanensis]SHH14540.1 amino acid/amide ABC transporter substrate-binding protein, HAAT family [Pollutimonas bauzanensis]